jgi:prepilin-type N-terminal cleavage/methylation domain-containing protein
MVRSNAGFSLIEVMVALTILAVGIIAIMRLFPAALTQSRQAAERTTVSSFANTELGRVKAGGIGGLDFWMRDSAQRSLKAAQGAYELYESWRYSVQKVGGSVDLFRVTFSVKMLDGRQERYVTYVTRQ